MEMMKSMNIGIHHPRKDQCDICIEFSLGTLPEEEYSAHVIRKDKGRAKKNAWKEKADIETKVVTMDLQSVLVCPKVEASSAYYRMNLRPALLTTFKKASKSTHTKNLSSYPMVVITKTETKF